jgi:hypothetical protein
MALNLPQKELRQKQSPRGNQSVKEAQLIAKAMQTKKLQSGAKAAMNASISAEHPNIVGKTIAGMPKAAKKILRTTTGWMKKK